MATGCSGSTWGTTTWGTTTTGRGTMSARPTGMDRRDGPRRHRNGAVTGGPRPGNQRAQGGGPAGVSTATRGRRGTERGYGTRAHRHHRGMHGQRHLAQSIPPQEVRERNWASVVQAREHPSTEGLTARVATTSSPRRGRRSIGGVQLKLRPGRSRMPEGQWSSSNSSRRRRRHKGNHSKQARGGFGSGVALSLAAQRYAQEVQKAQQRAQDKGIEPRADGRDLIQLTPMELQSWIETNLGGEEY